MASPAEVIRACLMDAGVVILPRGQELVPFEQLPGDDTTVCYSPGEADEPDQVVIVKDSVGLLFGQLLRDGKALVHPGVSLLIRSLDYDVGYALAVRVATVLGGIGRSTVKVGDEDNFVQAVHRTTPVTYLGEDGKRRFRWFVNFRVSFQDQQPVMG